MITSNLAPSAESSRVAESPRHVRESRRRPPAYALTSRKRCAQKDTLSRWGCTDRSVAKDRHHAGHSIQTKTIPPSREQAKRHALTSRGVAIRHRGFRLPAPPARARESHSGSGPASAGKARVRNASCCLSHRGAGSGRRLRRSPPRLRSRGSEGLAETYIYIYIYTHTYI